MEDAHVNGPPLHFPSPTDLEVSVCPQFSEFNAGNYAGYYSSSGFHSNPNAYGVTCEFGQNLSASQPDKTIMEYFSPESTTAYPIKRIEDGVSSYLSMESAAPLQDSRNNAVLGNNDSPRLEPVQVVTEKFPNLAVTENSVELSRLSVQHTRGSPKKIPPNTHAKPTLKSSRLTAQDRSRAAAKRTVKASSHAAVNEKTDPFTQWYQMMSQYYSQFYPGYQLPQPPGSSVVDQSPNVSRVESTPRHLNPKREAAQTDGSSNRAGPVIAHGAPPGGSFDYASYYYQYYYGAAASQFWPGYNLFAGAQPSGRKTPKLFHTPHIKASLSVPGLLLQILPTRPSDGEIARVELLDLGELASEAVAEAAKRVSEAELSYSNLNHMNDLSLDREVETRDGYSSGASGLESPGRLSSLQAGAGGDDGEAARACAAVALAWDRSDHTLYPGPLNRSSTLKADVLAFLREKMSEIQDRLPIDWESAGLLITYLEAMVKNNGNIQPTDLVNLLLEGHEPQTSELRARGSTNPSLSSTNVGFPIQYSGNAARSYLGESLVSLSPSQPTSGRQSPQTPLGMSKMNMFGQSNPKASSETGGFASTQSLLRRAAIAAGTLSSDQRNFEAEDKILDRFRELLMHGMVMKALEHACRYQLWGHAFVLSHRIGSSLFDKVMDRFLTRAIPAADPILTLYQLTSGEMPQAVAATAFGRGTDNGEWRPHLAMILAAESNQPELARAALERLGDSLLSRRLVYAAHLCYLLMGPLCKQTKTGRGQPRYYLQEKIWLLGEAFNSTESATELASPCSRSPLLAATEAIQLTETYEYAMKLANKNYRLPQLLPFKMVYATRLLDAGLIDKANRYLSAIGKDLLSEIIESESESSVVSPVLYSLTANCLRLAEPLQCHPELEGFEPNTFGTIGRSPGTPVPGRLTTNFHMETTTGWLERLREAYYEMTRKLVQTENLNVRGPSSVPQIDCMKPEPIPTDNPAQHSMGSYQQSHLNVSHSEPYHDQHPFSSSMVGSSSSDNPVSAYLIPAQQYSQPSPITASPIHKSSPAPSTSETRSPTCTPTTWPTSTHAHATQARQQTSERDRRDLNTPVNQQHLQMPSYPADYYHIAQHENPDAHGAPYANSINVAQSNPALHEIAQSTFYNRSDTSDTTVSQTHPAPVGQPMQNNLFFTPTVPSSPTNTTGFGTEQAFDYFAALQAGSRSRTISGGSQSSQAKPLPPSAHDNPQASRVRTNSGGVASQSRRSSGSFDRSPGFGIAQPQAPKQIGGFQRGPIKEEPPSNDFKPEEKTDRTEANQQSKEGWLSNWLGRLKRNGSKNVYLPDDSKPSIVWDDQQKQWINTSDPDGREPTPPPPPMPSTNMLAGAQVNSNQQAYDGASMNPPIPRVSSRSRYVNVLADQTSGSAASKIGGPLQPPLPPAVFTPQSTSFRQNDSKLEPNYPHQRPDGNNAYPAYDGSAGLTVRH